MEEKEKYFVFSEEEYAKNTKVMKSIGKTFYCGKVPVGDKVERFTNIIDKDHLTGMRQMFPYRVRLNMSRPIVSKKG